MSKSRREFLTEISMGLLSVSAGIQVQEQKPANPPPGAPPAFGTAQPVGPEVSPGTFAEAEKLVRVEMAASERAERQQVTGANPWQRSTSAAQGQGRFPLSQNSHLRRAGIRFCPA